MHTQVEMCDKRDLEETIQLLISWILEMDQRVKTMKLYINSNGCAVLKHETERIAKYFKLNGWERTSLVGEADFAVMTCCGVTQNEEDQAIGIINSLECERKKRHLL